MSMQNKLLHTHSKLYFGSKIVQKLKYRHIRQETCLQKEYQKVRKGPKENAFITFRYVYTETLLTLRIMKNKAYTLALLL